MKIYEITKKKGKGQRANSPRFNSFTWKSIRTIDELGTYPAQLEAGNFQSLPFIFGTVGLYYLSDEEREVL